MNLYLRYFDEEVVVADVNEAVAFLQNLNIEDFNIDEAFVKDLDDFAQSSVSYPKRYRIKGNNYFIFIKTNAADLEEFKRNNAKKMLEGEDTTSMKKLPKNNGLSEEQIGWYDGQLTFKRVISDPETRKAQYRDTVFRALVKANSPQHCYDRIVDYLKSRNDIDERSQFPSAKHKNFSYSFVGTQKPADIEV